MIKEEMSNLLSERNEKLYEYYRTHTAEETANKFGLGKNYVYNLVRRIKKLKEAR